MGVGLRKALAVVWVLTLALGGCAGPSLGPAVEPSVTQSSSDSVSGLRSPPAVEVVPPEPSASIAAQPSANPSLAALVEEMITPRDLRGKWKLAVGDWDGNVLNTDSAGGPLAGFYCAEGWPDLDGISKTQR